MTSSCLCCSLSSDNMVKFVGRTIQLMIRKKSEKWDKDEKDNTARLSSGDTPYSGTYPYLPKKVTVAVIAVAILMVAGAINSRDNGKLIELQLTEKLEAMSCNELLGFIQKHYSNYESDKALQKFVDKCSSYGD